MTRPTSPGKARSILALFVVIVMVASVLGPQALAAPTTNDPITDHLDLGNLDQEETIPHLHQNGTITTAQQEMSQGTTDKAIAGYEDDNGDWVANGDVEGNGDFEVNTTFDIDNGNNANTYRFRPGHIVDDSYTAFPDKADRTWDNASGWTVVNGASNVTISNTTVNADTGGVRFNTGTAGNSLPADFEIFHASYSKWDGELDSDESKRVFQIAVDVDTLEANSNVTISIEDESGDRKNFTINGNHTIHDNVTMIGNGTNDYVKQVKLSQAPTVGGGTFDNIESINVSVRSGTGTTSNADADFTISWLDLRKKSKNVLGEKRATTDDNGNDGDGDGEWDEFQTVYNSTNEIAIYSMETMDTEYDDATINDLSYQATFEAQGLDEQGEEGNYVFHWEEPDNPSYDHTLNMTVSLDAPAAVDLTYSGWATRMTQKWTSARYTTIESAAGVADSTNLSSAGFSDDSGSLGSKGDEITIDASTSAGERIVQHIDLQLTQGERDLLDVAAAAGTATPEGGAAPVDEGAGGGFFSTLAGKIVAVLGVIGGILGIRRFTNLLGGS